MIFFSEIKNKKVVTEDNVVVGKLDDLVFDFKDIPSVTKLIVKSEKLHHLRLFIPISYLLSMSEIIVLAKNYSTDYLKDNEMFVMKNLIDKQIIDIEGHKVVRVNDVILKQTSMSNLAVLGVDTGILGILRWLKLDDVIKRFFSLMGRHVKTSTLPWRHIQPLELTEGQVKLNINQDKLEDLHPEDLADYLEETSMDNIIKTINLLDLEFASEVIAELNLNYQITLFKKIGLKKTVEIIARMDPDEAVDVLSQVTTRTRKEVLARLEKNKRSELQELLDISGKTEVGESITSEFVSVEAEMTAGEIIEKIRRETSHISFLDYVYVTNKREQIIGVFNLHELLLQNPQTPVRKIMLENPATVHLHTPLKSVQRKLVKYKLSALPVVDEYKKIIGIITFDDVAEFFLEKI